MNLTVVSQYRPLIDVASIGDTALKRKQLRRPFILVAWRRRKSLLVGQKMGIQWERKFRSVAGASRLYRPLMPLAECAGESSAVNDTQGNITDAHWQRRERKLSSFLHRGAVHGQLQIYRKDGKCQTTGPEPGGLTSGLGILEDSTAGHSLKSKFYCRGKRRGV